MKKLFFFVIIFAIIAVGCTMILINIKNSQKAGTISSVEENSINQTTIIIPTDTISINPTTIAITQTQTQKLEKCLDLNTTYVWNDLNVNIEEYFYEPHNQTLKIPQISGLKDKKIENKINSEIKNRINDKMDECYAEEETDEWRFSYHEYDFANFSNVLSLYCHIYNGTNTKAVCFNYNLTNGENLKFEDLFTRDADIRDIVRMALYRYLIKEQNAEEYPEGEHIENIYYDNETQTWFATKIWNDVDGKHEELIEYIPPLSDYEIEKEINKFMKNPNKEFYFTPSKVYIITEKINNENCRVYFKDIANFVAIYDRFITEKSIFEQNNNIEKSFIACTEERNINGKQTKYESYNFFYDLNFNGIIAENFNTILSKKFVRKKCDDGMNEIQKRIDEYRQIANNNKDKAYFVFIEPTISSGINQIYHSEWEGEPWEILTNNIFITSIKEKVIECDINEKDTIMEIILEHYRYPNIAIYGAIRNFVDKSAKTDTILPIKTGVTEMNDEKYYDLFTGKCFTDGKEIFKDYVNPINTMLSLSNSNIALGDNPIFTLDSYGVTVTNADKKDAFTSVNYEKLILNNSVNIYELKEEMLPTDKRLITEDDWKGLDETRLNIAYNEIFARHGHDFQSEEYKFYFGLWDWYKPITGKVVEVSELTEIEKQNYLELKRAMDLYGY